jgi:hypothetical protein
VIGSIKRLRIRGEEGVRVRREGVNYLKARREQMKYEEYEKMGLPRGSGAVESVCKQMVSARCKQAGMRWSEKGADAILALSRAACCASLSFLILSIPRSLLRGASLEKGGLTAPTFISRTLSHQGCCKVG